MPDINEVTQRVKAPFGAWKLDRQKAGMRASYLSIFSWKSILLLEDRFLVKMHIDGPGGTYNYTVRLALLEYELQMMLLAGDCAIEPLGRIFDGHKICGIVMSFGVAISGRIPHFWNHRVYQPDFSVLPDKKVLIEKLHQLVFQLHGTGVIHGDIKPDNVLFCPDVKLRVCNFGCAFPEPTDKPSNPGTTAYTSPYRQLFPWSPSTRADDFYATGISTWELYSGQIPFSEFAVHDEAKDILSAIIRCGLQPDLTLIDDRTIQSSISYYLTAGCPPLPQGTLMQDKTRCIEAEVVFTHCVASPPHTYTKLARCESCAISSREDPCPNLCRVAQRVSELRGSRCMVCPVGAWSTVSQI